MSLLTDGQHLHDKIWLVRSFLSAKPGGCSLDVSALINDTAMQELQAKPVGKR
jgi:hypothetical protein